MSKRIVTTDIEIIDAVIKEAKTSCGEVYSDCLMFSMHDINHLAHNVVRKLTAPPEKVSDITGFPEDDVNEQEARENFEKNAPKGQVWTA